MHLNNLNDQEKCAERIIIENIIKTANMDIFFY